MTNITAQMFFSGVLGAQFSTLGFFASSALNLTAAQTVGSFAAAASAGFIGGFLFFVPAIILRSLVKWTLGLKPDGFGMFVLDLGITLAAAAVGAYVYGLPLVAMLTCSAIGIALTVLLDTVTNKLSHQSEFLESMFEEEQSGYCVGQAQFSF